MYLDVVVCLGVSNSLCLGLVSDVVHSWMWGYVIMTSGSFIGLGVTFTGLTIFNGSSMVLSILCIWVNEYISFMYGLEMFG